MKLRVKGNMIRLRLTKSEVDYFGNTFLIEEQTTFLDSVFTYSLSTSEDENVSASFANNRLTVTIPLSLAIKWTTTQLVGCSGEMDIGGGKKLYLLIEKDFKCLDETVEDQSDNFENPLSTSRT